MRRSLEGDAPKKGAKTGKVTVAKTAQNTLKLPGCHGNGYATGTSDGDLRLVLKISRKKAIEKSGLHPLEEEPRWIALDPQVKLARSALNAEFGEKTLLKNRVIYFAYPGHSHFQVETIECGTDFCGRYCSKQRYKSKMQFSRMPYHQITMHVTPNELKSLNTFLDSKQYAFGLTCAHTAAAILQKNSKLEIPFPLSVSPALSSWYLHRKMQQGWNRIGNITTPRDPPSRCLRIMGIVNEFCTALLFSRAFFYTFNHASILISNWLY